MTKGKIICVVGAPRTGKSFLVNKLSEHINAKAFYEGEENDFPLRLQEDISKNIRPMERILWFRNRLVEQYTQALRLRTQGETVVTDVSYLDVERYIDVLTDDTFEREVLHKMSQIDELMLGIPDKIIHLTSSEKKVREFIKLGGREFDASEGYYNEHVLPIANALSEYYKKYESSGAVITLNRDELDFNSSEDLQKVIGLISD